MPGTSSQVGAAGAGSRQNTRRREEGRGPRRCIRFGRYIARVTSAGRGMAEVDSPPTPGPPAQVSTLLIPRGNPDRVPGSRLFWEERVPPVWFVSQPKGTHRVSSRVTHLTRARRSLSLSLRRAGFRRAARGGRRLGGRHGVRPAGERAAQSVAPGGEPIAGGTGRANRKEAPCVVYTCARGCDVGTMAVKARITGGRRSEMTERDVCLRGLRFLLRGCPDSEG